MAFTLNGKEELAKWLNGDSATAPTHIGYGTGTTIQNETDTALETESSRTGISSNRSVRNVTLSIVIPSTEAIGESITEIGVFNASTSGTLFTRDVFSAIAKTSLFDIQVDITLSIE